MNKLYAIFVLFLSISVLGQEPEFSPVADDLSSALVSPCKSVSPSRWRSKAHFSTEKNVLDEIKQSIDELPEGGFLGVDDQYLTHSEMVDSIIDAKKRGVEVSVNMGIAKNDNAKKTVQRLHEASIDVKNHREFHAKRYIMCDKSPKVDDELTREKLGDTRVFLGSHNSSFVAPNHKEVMQETRNDLDFFVDNWQTHQNVFTYSSSQSSSQLSQSSSQSSQLKTHLVTTPNKRALISSQRNKSNSSKRARIDTLLNSVHEGDSIDIASMTLDSEEITASVENLLKKRKKNKPKVRIFLDQTALRKRRCLDRLADAGAEVHIYNKDQSKKVFGKYPEIQHTKTIIRQCGEKKLSIVSTGNLTATGESDINFDSYHPDDEKFFQEIKVFNDQLAEESTLYEKNK